MYHVTHPVPAPEAQAGRLVGAATNVPCAEMEPSCGREDNTARDNRHAMPGGEFTSRSHQWHMGDIGGILVSWESERCTFV